MDSFAHRHGRRPGQEAAPQTRGRLLDLGWIYDLGEWIIDTFVLRGRLGELRRRVLELADLGGGQSLLDVGCGTGTLAIEAAGGVGPAGRAVGIDPAPRQIHRARAKARRARLPIDFRVAAIEALPFPDGSFDVVTSTLMMHHLPDDVKGQGLAEIARVLKPGGRLVVCDFEPSRKDDPASASAGGAGNGAGQWRELLASAGFEGVEVEGVPFPTLHRGWAGALYVRAAR